MYVVCTCSLCVDVVVQYCTTVQCSFGVFDWECTWKEKVLSFSMTGARLTVALYLCHHLRGFCPSA